jgi:hypothetical protein
MRRWKNRAGVALLLAVVALLAACSSISLREREMAERARIEAYAGQPVDHFTWLGRYWGWKPLSKDQALVWTTPDRGYLVKVEAPCEDLRFANHIGLTSTLHTVYSRGLDYVKVRGWRCPIKEIRPVDYGRLQADLRRERQMQGRQAEDVSKDERKTG